MPKKHQVQKRSDQDSEACPPSQSEATEDSEVFCRDVSTNLWYKASVIGRRKDGSLEMEWSAPFEGRIVVTADDIRSDDTGLVATDDNPPTEWQERCTSSQHSSVQESGHAWCWPEGVHVIMQKELTKSDTNFERGTLTLTRPLGCKLKEILGGLGEMKLLDCHGTCHDSLRLREHANNGSYYVAGWGKLLRMWKPKIEDYVVIAQTTQIDAQRTLAVGFSSHQGEQPDLSWAKPTNGPKLQVTSTVSASPRRDPEKRSRKRRGSETKRVDDTWTTKRSVKARRGEDDTHSTKDGSPQMSSHAKDSVGIKELEENHETIDRITAPSSGISMGSASTAEAQETVTAEKADTRPELPAPSTDALDFLAAIAQQLDEPQGENQEIESPAPEKLQMNAPAEHASFVFHVPVQTQLLQQ